MCNQLQTLLQSSPSTGRGTRLAAGGLEVVVGERFDHEDAAKAYQYTEDRKSSGKIVLEP